MKDQRIKRPRTPVRVRKSTRVKEDCQVSRIQKPKSLEDWHNIRVKTQEDDSTIFPPARGGETEEGKTDSQSMVKPSEYTPESAPDPYWISIKRAINLLPRKRKRA
jgi:hypothetical protein